MLGEKLTFFYGLACRTKLLLASNSKSNYNQNPSLILDSIYLSLCIELAYDGTRELLVAVLGIAYLGGQLLTRPG